MPRSDPESTLVLLSRAASGEETAINTICDRYLPALRRWAHGRMPRAAREMLDTEDLVQETLIRAVKRLDRFEPEHSGAFAGYLRTALQNRVRDEIRKFQRRPGRVDAEAEPDDAAPSPLEQALGAETMERYEAALHRLDERQRGAVVARLELDLSYREIAETMGHPSPDAARMAVSRAIVVLAEELSRD